VFGSGRIGIDPCARGADVRDSTPVDVERGDVVNEASETESGDRGDGLAECRISGGLAGELPRLCVSAMRIAATELVGETSTRSAGAAMTVGERAGCKSGT